MVKNNSILFLLLFVLVNSLLIAEPNEDFKKKYSISVDYLNWSILRFKMNTEIRKTKKEFSALSLFEKKYSDFDLLKRKYYSYEDYAGFLVNNNWNMLKTRIGDEINSIKFNNNFQNRETVLNFLITFIDGYSPKELRKDTTKAGNLNKQKDMNELNELKEQIKKNIISFFNDTVIPPPVNPPSGNPPQSDSSKPSGYNFFNYLFSQTYLIVIVPIFIITFIVLYLIRKVKKNTVVKNKVNTIFRKIFNITHFQTPETDVNLEIINTLNLNFDKMFKKISELVDNNSLSDEFNNCLDSINQIISPISHKIDDISLKIDKINNKQDSFIYKIDNLNNIINQISRKIGTFDSLITELKNLSPQSSSSAIISDQSSSFNTIEKGDIFYIKSLNKNYFSGRENLTKNIDESSLYKLIYNGNNKFSYSIINKDSVHQIIFRDTNVYLKPYFDVKFPLIHEPNSLTMKIDGIVKITENELTIEKNGIVEYE